jgi:TPP-dependent pyruvate/acetoin dehydrogenase alpha subunit
MGKKHTGRSLATIVAAPTGKEEFSLISNDKLLALYANLLTCRMALQRAATKEPRTRTRAGSLRGCEAGTVAATIDLGPQDIVSAADHTLLTSFLKGPSAESILHSFSRNGRAKPKQPANSKGSPAKRNGAARPTAHQEPMHAIIGAALTNKAEKNGKVAVVFDCGGEGDAWKQAIEIATVYGLPIIFVSQQDGKSEAGFKQRGAERSKAVNSDTPYFPSITVDGHDVVAVYRVANEAISRARKGRGPTLIECRPFRANPGQDVNGNAGKYRHSQDAVANMESYLSSKGLLNRKLKDEMLTSVSREFSS